MTARRDGRVPIPRRPLLASAAVALAGCQSSESESTTAGDATATDTPTDTETPTATTTTVPVADATFTVGTTESPPQTRQYHVGGALGMEPYGVPTGELPAVCFDRLATVGADGSVVGMALDDWSVSDDRITVTVDESTGWSDGSPARGADWGAFQQLRRWTEVDRSPAAVADAGDPDEILEATREVTWDGQTATMHAIEDDEGGLYRRFPAAQWVREALVDSHLSFHRDHTRPFVEAIRGRVNDPYTERGQEELERIITGVTTIDGETDTDTAEPTPTAATTDRETQDMLPVSGPFQVASIEPEERIVFERNPNFRLADQIGWDTLAHDYSESDSGWSPLVSGEVDALEGVLRPDVEATLPSSVETHRTGGYPEVISMNQFSDPHLGDPRVRWALSDAINRAAFTDRPDRSASGTPGLDYPEHERDVSGDLATSFRDLTFDRDRAARRLREAGFTRKDGTWYTPEGERWSLSVLAWENDNPVESTVVDHLSAFGIDTILDAVDGETFDKREESGDWDLRVSWMGSGRPFALYYSAFASVRYHDRIRLWDRDAALEWAANTEGVAARFHETVIEGFTPEQVRDRWTKAAPPVGEPDASERIDFPVVADAWQLVFGPVPEGTYRDLRRTLAWVFNWRLPVIPLYLNHGVIAIDSEEWAVTDTGALAPDSRSVTTLLQQGRIRPVDSG